MSKVVKIQETKDWKTSTVTTTLFSFLLVVLISSIVFKNCHNKIPELSNQIKK